MRHGLPIQWLSALGAAVAQAQTPSAGGRAPPPPFNGTSDGRTASAEGLPPAAPTGNLPPGTPNRARQAPYTQAKIDSAGGLEVTRPVPVPGAKVVARVGNEVILAADVLPQVNEEFAQEARHCHPDQHAQLFEMIMAKHVKQTADFKLIAVLAKKDIPEDKLPEMEKQILSHFDKIALPGLLKHWKVQTKTELDAKLKQHGSSLEKQKKAFVEQALVSEWMRKEVKVDEHVGPQELLNYYHQHHTEYEFKAKVRFEEIRVNYGNKKRSKQDAWRSINDLAGRIYSGASMAELAKSHSEGHTAANGGLHDWTNQGSLACDDVDAALFTLPVGALSKVIDDQRGFMIVRAVERKDAGVISYQDAQAGIRDNIKAERVKEAQNKKVAELNEKYKFRVWTAYDDLLRQVEKARSKKRR
jgi:hypothetical protein